MGRKEELEIEIETLQAQLENAEKRLWEINTKKWCETWLEENKEITINTSKISKGFDRRSGNDKLLV